MSCNYYRITNYNNVQSGFYRWTGCTNNIISVTEVLPLQTSYVCADDLYVENYAAPLDVVNMGLCPSTTPTPTVTPTPTPNYYSIELRLTGMVDRNGEFVLEQSSDGSSWDTSVTLTTTSNEVAIQSFNGTPGYYYRYTVTKTSGAQCRANAYNNIVDILGDFNPGPIMTFSPYCEFDSVTHPSFQLPNPKQSRSYISFNGTLDGACL